MEMTLCWDCAKATGGCSWSKNFQPVPGWEAKGTVKQQFRGEPMKSVLVRECPEFERDALNGGLKRVKPEEQITPEIEGDGRSSWWWVCGECHAMLEYKAKECKHCGRRVKWE